MNWILRIRQRTAKRFFARLIYLFCMFNFFIKIVSKQFHHINANFSDLLCWIALSLSKISNLTNTDFNCKNVCQEPLHTRTMRYDAKTTSIIKKCYEVKCLITKNSKFTQRQHCNVTAWEWQIKATRSFAFRRQTSAITILSPNKLFAILVIENFFFFGWTKKENEATL